MLTPRLGSFSLTLDGARRRVVVTARGELGDTTCRTVHDLLTELTERRRGLAVVLDAHALTAPSAALLELIAALAATTAGRGGSFVLADPPATVADALRVNGLGHLAAGAGCGRR